jgi:outer membrane murein-binding lipoprotein Lpp
MLVDPEKKARLERDVERLQAKCRQLSADGGEKRTLAKDLKAQIEQLEADRVQIPLDMF